MPIRLAVVEAVFRSVRPIFFRVEDEVEPAGLRIEEVEPALQGDDEATALAHGDASDVLGRLPDAIFASRRIEAVDRGAFDIQPPENLIARIPERPLAESSLGVDDAFDVGHYRSFHCQRQAIIVIKIREHSKLINRSSGK